MAVLKSEIRAGAYADSIVLLQLQSALSRLPGVVDAGVVMGTGVNLDVLKANDLFPAAAADAGPDDMVVVVKAESEQAAEEALGQIDALMARRSAAAGGAHRPHSLETALKMLPEARWVSISVPGRYAAALARQALEAGRHVFLYSDNVALGDEVELKRLSAVRGLLLMGPDCGTAIVNGIGLGFANRVRRGPIGLVGASGTGLQAISTRIHRLGEGVSHAIGTGGRDLHREVGAVTARQGLDLLARHAATAVIVLVSKPPAPEVATRVLADARRSGKPVVVYLVGQPPPARRLDNLVFATGLVEAADLALEALAGEPGEPAGTGGAAGGDGAPSPGYLRGLFAGGTLALEALQAVRSFVTPLHSNLGVQGVAGLDDPSRSRGHTIVDLGADELTVGRPHPMIDQELRLRRLRQEAADDETGLILLDVVLGEGAHPDPAAELAPAIEEVRRARQIEVVVLVVGTDEDPQEMEAQCERLKRAGAVVFDNPGAAMEHVIRRLQAAAAEPLPAVAPAALDEPVAAINLGLESFYSSLVDQGARAVHVDWRPPAGGDEKLMAILEKMRR